MNFDSSTQNSITSSSDDLSLRNQQVQTEYLFDPTPPPSPPSPPKRRESSSSFLRASSVCDADLLSDVRSCVEQCVEQCVSEKRDCLADSLIDRIEAIVCERFYQEVDTMEQRWQRNPYMELFISEQRKRAQLAATDTAAATTDAYADASESSALYTDMVRQIAHDFRHYFFNQWQRELRAVRPQLDHTQRALLREMIGERLDEMDRKFSDSFRRESRLVGRVYALEQAFLQQHPIEQQPRPYQTQAAMQRQQQQKEPQDHGIILPPLRRCDTPPPGFPSIPSPFDDEALRNILLKTTPIEDDTSDAATSSTIVYGWPDDDNSENTCPSPPPPVTDAPVGSSPRKRRFAQRRASLLADSFIPLSDEED